MLKQKILDTVPRGTFAIGSGMGIGAITGYIVVIAVNHSVGDRQYAGFGAFWSLIFVVGPGLFLPLEQEISRAISHRAAREDGSANLLKLVLIMAATLALVVCLIAAAFTKIIVESVFHGSNYLQLGFILGIIGYGLLHCSRGVLSGNHKFGAYGTSLASEGIVRFTAVMILSALGVDHVGPYGVVMGLSPIIAVIPFIPLIKSLITPGTHASKKELGTALSYLVSSSVLSQALAYSSLFIINVIEGDTGQTARWFTNAFFIARIPVIGFMAVQAALLPKLSTFHSLGEHSEFRHQFKKLFYFVLLISTIGIIFIAVAGEQTGMILFGKENFNISNIDFLILAVGSCLFLTAQTLLQACIALQHYKVVTVAYLFGVFTTIITTLIFLTTEISTVLWVSLSFSAGCIVAVCILYVAYEKVIRNYTKEEMVSSTAAI